MIQWILAIWSVIPLPFLKSSLNIWKFTIHVLLKPGLENFERYFASKWDESSLAFFMYFTYILLIYILNNELVEFAW